MGKLYNIHFKNTTRLIKVSDADLGVDATRVDQVWLHQLGNAQGTAGIQMHYERLLSRADTADVRPFSVSIEIDDTAAQPHGADGDD